MKDGADEKSNASGVGAMRDQHGSARGATSRSDRTAPSRPDRADRLRITHADLVAFRRALDAATRRAVVTPLLVLACGASFAAMIATGVPILWPSAGQLIDWGANDGARLILRHEYWRLAASVFVHGGLIHLVVNMWSLLVIGPLVERIYGHLAFLVVYLAAGIGGAIASVAMPPMRVSVGASGAICGLLGALLAFLLVHRRAIPPTVFGQLRRNVFGVVLFMAALGVVVTNIDQAAHLGGLATGFACGLLLIGPWPVPQGPRRGLLARRAAFGVAIAAGLAGAAIGVAHWGDSIVPPDRRLDDFSDQLAPVLGEFNRIRRDLARSVGHDRKADSADRVAMLATLRDLRARGVANAARLGHIRATHPDLRAIRDSLARALAGQDDRIVALSRYLETGDPAALEEANEALATTIGATEECEEYRLRYMKDQGLVLRHPEGYRDR